MKILFLDIDGVLNNHKSLVKQSYSIDPYNVENLNKIIRATDCQIVLMSAWRYLILDRHMTLRGFETLLSTHGVLAYRRLIDLTEQDTIVSERWHQVENWIKANKEKVDTFVMLDDCEEFPNYPQNFVKTDMEFGLTEQDADKAILILGENHNEKV